MCSLHTDFFFLSKWIHIILWRNSLIMYLVIVHKRLNFYDKKTVGRIWHLLHEKCHSSQEIRFVNVYNLIFPQTVWFFQFIFYTKYYVNLFTKKVVNKNFYLKKVSSKLTSLQFLRKSVCKCSLPYHCLYVFALYVSVQILINL